MLHRYKLNNALCLLAVAGLAQIFSSCSEYLDAKPSQSLVIPGTLAEYEAILDNTRFMNGMEGDLGTPALGEISADDYYIEQEMFYDLLSDYYKDIYVWAENPRENQNIVDWNSSYRAIFYANVVMDGLGDIDRTVDNSEQYDRIRCGALFHRGLWYFHLAQVFAQPYVEETSAALPGLPLRLRADVGEKLGQATLSETYGRILDDLQSSVEGLPVVPVYPTRASKPAAYAMLARVYLVMHRYEEAARYADSCLRLKSDLLDFNGLAATQDYYPFERFNREVVFHSVMIGRDFSPVNPAIAIVNTALYDSYSDTDHRKALYFVDAGDLGNGFLFRGSYDGTQGYFSGLATDEVLLTYAECLARLGRVNEAMDHLNRLLETRYETDGFISREASGTGEAIELVLSERRKELQRRGIRWMDLRRLNSYPEYARELVRIVNQRSYLLPPLDNRYRLPIPLDILAFNESIR